ncbi:VanZ family protein [Clostridium sp. WILCCON 0269]|uniref:VanZ family protein n=1 Tax=Candidatus Clostridium eludens TaxID=3381663 RepID=A0ABW8SRS6_9CLOT
MKKIKWILVIVWMVVIFVFSNEPAVVSNEKSRLVIHIFQALGLNLNGVFGSLSNFVVRKVSHFLEYLILAVVLFNATKEKFEMKKVFIFSIAVLFLYSCSDEIHQIFIPGRTARIRDVFIDTIGGIIGFLICYIINKKNSYKREL